MVGYDEVPVVTVGGGVFDRFRRWLRRVIDECWFERVGRKGDSRAVDVNDIVAVIDSFNYLMWTRVRRVECSSCSVGVTEPRGGQRDDGRVLTHLVFFYYYSFNMPISGRGHHFRDRQGERVFIC